MVQVSNSKGAAHSERHVDVCTPVADVSVSGAFDVVEKYSNVEMVDGVPKDAAVKANVTFIDGAQSSASEFEEDCAGIVDVAASNADIDELEGKSVTIQKFSSDSFHSVGIVAQPVQITEVSLQLRTASLEYKYKIRNFFMFTGTTRSMPVSQSLSKLE